MKKKRGQEKWEKLIGTLWYRGSQHCAHSVYFMLGRVMLDDFYIMEYSLQVQYTETLAYIWHENTYGYCWGPYLFQDANRFLRAKLEENCELQACVYYPSNSLQHAWKNVYKHLTVCSMGFFLLHVPCSLERNKQKKIFLGNKHKNLLSSWIGYEMKTHQSGCRFENWGISLGWYSQILPSFNWGIFSHVLHLNQLSVCKIILWIIYMHTLWTDVWLIALIYHTHMMFLLFAIQPNNQEESFWETQNFSLSCCFLMKK